MDHWSLRYPTCTEDIGRVLAEAAEKLLALSVDARKAVSGGTRILHFSAEERMTKFEICETLAGILGLELGQMRANEQGNDPAASVQRPYDCHLSTAELQELGVDVRAQKFEPWFRRYLRAVRR
ncbi:hypothetical protein FH972_024532 [Carpinus fangiana]|uniref:RmlD-like substrate binding domain-containing protein n=1 Tax=Carpinus fangiana TaxID=176857 RepID=A0A5N6KYA1_9ROSI|nr:hypothetical protein FH972_024532 [Carpinus fangiana]